MADDKDKAKEGKEEVETLTKKKRDYTAVLTMAVLALTMIILVGASVTATVVVMSMNDKDSSSSQSAGSDTAIDGDQQTDNAEKESQQDTVPSKAPEEVFYAALDPLVVNFGDTASKVRFLQVSIELMLHEESDIEVVKKHMPVILDKLVLELSHHSFVTLNSQEGKEEIRVKAFEAVKKTMKEVTGRQVVHGLFFTGFIMQ